MADKKIKITLTKSDGAVLFETTTSSFPVPVNMTNITGSSKGLITMTYTVKKEVAAPEPADGTETSTSAPTEIEEERTITREVEFVEEED